MAFQKKTSKTPIRKIDRAIKNLKKYFNDYKQVIILIYLRIFLKFCDNINYFD